MYQKREISLPMGYKTARPKQETGNDCDVISELKVSRRTDFSGTFVPFLGEFLSSQKETGEICFPRSLKSCNDVIIIHSLLSLYPTGSKISLLWYTVHENTGTKNSYRILLCYTYRYIVEILSSK